MKAIVCMKQVPDTESSIRLNGDRTDIERGDLTFVINPYDEYAIEAALQLKEQAGDGEVVLLSIGGSGIKSTLQKGMAMGADRSVHLHLEESTPDSFAVARMLADQLQNMEYDIILFGKEAIDDAAAQVGPMVGELLGLPAVSRIVSLDVAAGTARVTREVEGGQEAYNVTLPAVFTTEKGLNQPRYPKLKGIMQAKKKPVDLIEVTPGENMLTTASLEYPPPRKEGQIVGEGAEAVPELLRLLKEEAKVI